MKLDYQTKNKVIDAIAMLNNRFFQLLGKPLSLTREQYLANPLLHIKLDQDPDSAGTVIIHIHNRLILDDSNAEKNHYRSFDVVSGLKFTNKVKQFSTFQLANILQTQIVQDLLNGYSNNYYNANNQNEKYRYNNQHHSATLMHYLTQNLLSKAKYLDENALHDLLNDILSHHSELIISYQAYRELIKQIQLTFIGIPVENLRLIDENGHDKSKEINTIKSYVNREIKILNAPTNQDLNYLRLSVRLAILSHYAENSTKYSKMFDNPKAKSSLDAFFDYIIYTTPGYIKDYYFPNN